MKAYINPGHDRFLDPGACGNGLQEAKVVYEACLLLREYLERAGVEIVGFMQDDDLYKVVKDANNSDADIFISVHCNSYSKPEPQGTETLVYEFGGESEVLAQCIQAQIVDSLDTVDRGIKQRPGLFVLSRTLMPAVLVELAFVSNDEDAELLKTRLDDFAKAIARGVTDYQIESWIEED